MRNEIHDKIAEMLGYTVHKQRADMPHGSHAEVIITRYCRGGLPHTLSFERNWEDIAAAYRALKIYIMPVDKRKAADDLETIMEYYDSKTH